MVLWIDDDAPYLKAVANLLGLETTIQYARSVEEALELASSEGRVALVILDAIVRVERRSILKSSDLEDVTQRKRQHLLGVDPYQLTQGQREGNGLIFIKRCEALGIEIDQLVLISFVPDKRLREEFGYRCDKYIAKLALPDDLEELRRIIVASQGVDVAGRS
jgi:DNA-binding NarL/FixJ family response regulator